MNRRIPDRALAAVASVALVAGCSVAHEAPPDFATQMTVAEETAPLGGTALNQRRLQLERAYRDLVQLHTTLESLHQHDDRKGVARLARFIEAYMGMHLDRLLAHEWQSRHPELMALDANLRFIKADVLIRMDSTGRARGVIKDIERRFRGREGMLVEYPIGQQNALEKGLEILKRGRWKGYS